MSNFSSIRNFFSSRKTTAAANAPPVARSQQANKQTSVRVIQTTKPRYFSLGIRVNYRSIFSRIASSFKTGKERTSSMAGTKTIRKEVKKNMTQLKKNIPSELQNLHTKMRVGKEEISDRYVRHFPLFQKTLTGAKGTTALSEPSRESMDDDRGASVYAQHLTEFCGGNKSQASTLSTILTADTLDIVNQQLRKDSSALREITAATTMLEDVKMDVRMVANKTARVVITQRFDNLNELDNLLDKPDTGRAIIVKTTIDVIRKDPNSEINPIILRDVNFTEAQ